jgi:fructosamine-3-kinase
VQALTFDALGYVKQLTSAGVDPQVAEIHAMTMANAFGMYIDNVVTTEYLDATLDKRFAEFDLRMERRFGEQDSKVERRFSEQEKRTSDLELAISDKFAEQDAKFELRFSHIEGYLKVLKWGQAIVVAAVLLPELAALLA